MSRSYINHLFAGLVVFTLIPFLCVARLNAVKVGSKINVTVDGRFFTSYIFAGDEKYPFFYPVNGPGSGSSVTSMRNGEYPHHSSLFFGCDLVNGGNYWQEGLERGRIISVNAEILQEGGDTVVISDECIWSRPNAPAPFKDSRKYIITAPSKEVRQIDVEIVLEPLVDVQIMKTNHSLFSVRMAADLSVKSGGTMVNAEGDKGEKGTFGKPSAWIDFFGEREDRIEGLALMQHPSNPWFPSPWFTRDYGFMSPTPMYWPENGQSTGLQRGERLMLRYRVLVHAGVLPVAAEFEKYRSGK